ncbi:MAG: hypothetical protein UV98_C0020G0012 [Parcubacteria group bacterium GW2011_GWB1_43_6]|nr:MAG: hypothetical protein UV98_C0020G0012 [Parcubacteria group bacterium GW2011_GWB1_43_6]
MKEKTIIKNKKIANLRGKNIFELFPSVSSNEEMIRGSIIILS